MSFRLAPMFALCLATIGAACAAPLAFERLPYTSQPYLDALPAIGELIAADEAPTLAWVRQLQGRRSIWLANGREMQARERHAYPNDDGIPISQMSLSSDGRYLAYVRGGWPNRDGEINNSLDAPDPYERALWILETQGTQPPRRVIGGTTPPVHAPAISPDSRTIAYAQGSEIWLAPLPSGAPARAATIRGFVGSLVWSPDGRRLAFTSERGSHSFVGVLDTNGREVRYLEPGLDADRQPVWSADGSWLAFIRIREEAQTYRFTPRREGIPWSIMAAEMPSGSVHTVWSATTGSGSVYSGLARSLSAGLGPPANRSSLMWTHDHHLVFPWEKTGWRQLYRVSVDGGPATALTHGNGEVTAAEVSADGRAIVFQANSRTLERFDVWRIATSGGDPTLLWSEGAPYDEPAVVLNDARVAFIGETSRTPRQILLNTPGETSRPLLPDAIPAEFPAAAMVVPNVVELKAEDGFLTRGLLFRPQQAHEGRKLPALVWAHGGPTDIALPGVSKYDSRWLQSAVQAGYVVLAVNYRAGSGYGLQFREAEGYGGGGGNDVYDVIAAGHYLAALPDVDAKRIGVFGQSYGGYLTTAALARAPELWAAGVSVVGVADWQMEMELDAGGAPLPFRLKQRMALEELAFESSANAHLVRWRAPILFVSGDDDQAGWLVAAIQLGQSLRRRGIEVEALVEPGGTHGPGTHRQFARRVQRTFGFFDRHLKPAR